MPAAPGEGSPSGTSRRGGFAVRAALLLAATVLCLVVVELGLRVDVPPEPARHVILLSLDTFRADAAGWLGDGATSLTPHLDAFAAHAVSFPNARAQMPFTQPSHMSMFTGLYPIVHRVHSEKARLHPAIVTLPEILAQRGFATHGFYVNLWMLGLFGFERGFDRYTPVEGGTTHADHLNRAVFATLDTVDAAVDRLFLFVQYFDPHSDDKAQTGSSLPYYSPDAYRESIEIADPDASFCDTKGRCATHYLLWADREKREVDEARLAQTRALYDAGIRFLDDELGRLFARLREDGLYDNALIIVTADHGEGFREHGSFLHDDTYEENIAVPLLIKFPDGAWAGRSIEVLAESVDLLPTIADQLGIPASSFAPGGNPDALQGRSLLPSIVGAATPRDHALAQDNSRRDRFALTDSRYKLIYDSKSGTGKLFDLSSDPGETQDLAAAEPKRFAAMRRVLEEKVAMYEAQAHALHRAAPSSQTPASEEPSASLSEEPSASLSEEPSALLSEEQKARLRGIGYLVE